MNITKKKIEVSQDGNTAVWLATKKVEELPQQKEWKHKRAKNMKYSENGKLFNWSGAYSVLEAGEGDVRLEVKVATNLCEPQRGANQGSLSRGATWYNLCSIHQKVWCSIWFSFPLNLY